jgi:hypothetical protein
MINKEFTPYEQALALKAIGFNEPCLKYWNGIGEYFDQKDWFNWNQSEKFVSIPLYQQAFRWFREKYNIQGYIYSSTVRGNSEKTKQFTGYIWNINGIDMPFISTDARDELHDTYEEAELYCLRKLIEIVKTKIR